MANDLTFRVTGDKKVDRALRTLEPKLAKKVIRQALRKAARPLLARVKQLAPAGETGQLRKKVKLRASARTRKKVIRFRVLLGDEDFKGKTFYGAFVNLGTKRSGTGRKGQRRGKGQPGQGFFQRAKRETEAEVKRIAIDEIRAGVEREARG